MHDLCIAEPYRVQIWDYLLAVDSMGQSCLHSLLHSELQKKAMVRYYVTLGCSGSSKLLLIVAQAVCLFIERL